MKNKDRTKFWFTNYKLLGEGSYGAVYSSTCANNGAREDGMNGAKGSNNGAQSGMNGTKGINNGAQNGMTGTKGSNKSQSKELANGQDVAIKRHFIEPHIFGLGTVKELSMLSIFRDHPCFVNIKTIYFGNPFMKSNNGPFIPLPPVKEKHGLKLKEDKMFFVMERAHFDCSQYIHSAHYNVKMIKKGFVDLLLAVEFMEKNKIIHRDLKPNNLLWVQSGNNVTLKIADFGISNFYTKQTNMAPRPAIFCYRAPELLYQNKTYSHEVDMWAIGCIFYELVTKRKLVRAGKGSKKDLIYQHLFDSLPTNLHADLLKCDGGQSKIDKESIKYYIDQIDLCRVRQKKIDKLKNGNKRNKLVELQKYKTSKYKKIGWAQKIGLSPEVVNLFNSAQVGTADTYNGFLEILNLLLQPDPKKRQSAKQLLNHKFFDYARDYINEIRAKNKIDTNPYIRIVNNKERVKMLELAQIFYSNRDYLKDRIINKGGKMYREGWYTDRILFQAMDLYDRYLVWKHDHKYELDLNKHDITLVVTHIKIKFMVCLYLAYKLFNNQIAITFVDLLDMRARTDDNLAFAAKFEKFLVHNILNSVIYRETLYETADYFGLKLNNSDISKIINKYVGLNTCTHRRSSLFKICYGMVEDKNLNKAENKGKGDGKENGNEKTVVTESNDDKDDISAIHNDVKYNLDDFKEYIEIHQTYKRANY